MFSHVSVYWPVGLWAGLHKTYWMDFHQNEGVQFDVDANINPGDSEMYQQFLMYLL